MTGRGPVVLVAIATFKVLKAVGLLVVGVAAFSLAHDGNAHLTLEAVADHLKFGPDDRLVDRALGAIFGLDTKKLDELGLGTFVYAAVFLTEGIGLMLQRHWAEYLTLAVTTSFIPFEIYELAERATALRVVALLVNALIAAYLLVRVLPLRSAVRSRAS